MNEKILWDFLEEHLNAIYSGDFEKYKNSCIEDLGLYEWFVAPHRIDGLDFHKFMMESDWAGTHNKFNIMLLDKRAQIYDNCAILSYTLVVSSKNEEITHKVVNESRVVVNFDGILKVVHVHKSPGK
ncbi:protein kinase [Deferribacterales bacterium Es71-Z0220]|uniref:protein kinase n=1 Tax=Deferrivibrio essentukiensis TaxID=2880922 RepID=UPI001F600289|nr:protein kinase [Deferrivibrio essentukiensis]